MALGVKTEETAKRRRRGGFFWAVLLLNILREARPGELRLHINGAKRLATAEIATQVVERLLPRDHDDAPLRFKGTYLVEQCNDLRLKMVFLNHKVAPETKERPNLIKFVKNNSKKLLSALVGICPAVQWPAEYYTVLAMVYKPSRS